MDKFAVNRIDGSTIATLEAPSFANAVEQVRDKLQNADLRDEDLSFADLDGANMDGADLRNTALIGTQLRGASAVAAIVDGRTLIRECTVDRRTNFSMVGLQSSRIDLRTLRVLERNARAEFWREALASFTERLVQSSDWDWSEYRQGNKLVVTIHWCLFCLIWCLHLVLWCMGYLLTVPVRYFWWTSDYGHSTFRLLVNFAAWVMLFSAAYTLIPEKWNEVIVPQYKSLMPESNRFGPITTPVLSQIPHSRGEMTSEQLLVRATTYSVLTMTTLGFADVEPTSTYGHGILCCHVLVGYYFLGALLTRLGVMFQLGA